MLDTLDGALEAWRRKRHPRLAAVVDAIAAKTPAPKLPRGGIQLAWTEAKPNDHVVLGALLPALARSVPVQKDVIQWRDNHSKTRLSAWCTRLRRLEKWQDDPRVAAALVEIVRAPPFEMGDTFTGKWLYQPALELIVRIGDVRGKPLLEALLERPTATTKNLREFFAAELPRVIAALPDPPALDAATEAECDAVLGNTIPALVAARPEHEAELFAAVVAEPDSDGPRAVLGDYWLERGDLRGELVALQLKAARSEDDDARIRALVRADTWLGADLRRVTKLRVYRRGFLDAFELLGSSVADAAGWQRAAADPALATVRTIERGVGTEASLLAFLTSPAVRSLTSAPVNRRMLDALAAGPTAKQIRSLLLDLPIDEPAFSQLDRFPALRSVAFVRTRDQLATTATALARWPGRTRLAELGVRVNPFSAKKQIAAWLRDYAKLGVPIVFVDLDRFPYDQRIVMRGPDDFELHQPTYDIMMIVALLRRVRRLVIHTDAPRPDDPTRWQTTLKRLAPKERVIPERWLRVLGR